MLCYAMLCWAGWTSNIFRFSVLMKVGRSSEREIMTVDGIGVANVTNTAGFQQSSQNKNSKSYGGWLVGAGTLGAAAWGYNTKSYLKESGKFTDIFEKTCADLISHDVKNNRELTKETKTTLVEMEKLNNIDDVKKFLTENKIAQRLRKLLNISVERDIKEFTESVNEKGFANAVDDLKVGIKYSDQIETTAQAFKMKSALKYGGVAALIGVGALILKNIFSNKDKA